jgi:hypothetical protein
MLMLTQTGQAHPGHSLNEHGLLHIVTSPFHLLLLTVMGIGSWCAARFVSNAMGRRFLRFGAAAAVTTAILLWSFGG